MNKYLFFIFVFALFLFASKTSAQVHEICSRASGNPTLGEAWGAVPYVFGKITVDGLEEGAKLPKVAIGFTERARTETRVVVDKTGNYCFRRTNAEVDAVLVVYFDGIEVGRRDISGLGPIQQREDFEFKAGQTARRAAPGTISAKYNYPPNPKTDELYKKAIDAEKVIDTEEVIRYVKEIVAADPADFVAWAKLGSVYLEKKEFDDAETAFKKSIEARADFVPAIVNLGRTYLAQIKTDQAIATLQKAVATDPKYAPAYRFLGTAYLQAKKGSLGVENLNKAIELDRVGSAEAHLLLATLYDRAGAKDLASHEYKLFIEKVPNHPDRKKFEKYIKDNHEN